MTERYEPGDEDERRRAEDDERRPSEESGDDPRRHARILQHRWEGSPPPTAERYARALQQWRALPGAVVSPGALVTASADETGPDEGSQP